MESKACIIVRAEAKPPPPECQPQNAPAGVGRRNVAGIWRVHGVASPASRPDARTQLLSRPASLFVTGMPARPRALAIAAHPDDIEFLMAGTLLRLKEAGWVVLGYLVLWSLGFNPFRRRTPRAVKYPSGALTWRGVREAFQEESDS